MVVERVKLKDREYTIWVTSDRATRDEFYDELEIRDRYFKVGSGDVVIDIGSQYGNYTLDACSLGARVYAFDPNPKTYGTLKANLELNGFDSHRLFNLGLWSRSGELSIKDYAPHSDWEGKFRATTLDEWAELHGVNRIDFIKIDTEGAELEILKGGLNSIKRFKPKLLVEVHTFVNESLLPAVEDFLKGLGYSCERIPRPPATMVYCEVKG